MKDHIIKKGRTAAVVILVYRAYNEDMKRKLTLIFSGLLLCLLLLGCDDIMPSRDIVVDYEPQPLRVGETATIKIIYPDIAATSVVSWGEARIGIIRGDDVIALQGLTITGLKAGTATLIVGPVPYCNYGLRGTRECLRNQGFQVEVVIEVQP